LPLTTKVRDQGTPASWSLGLINPDGSIVWQHSYRLTQVAHTIEVKLVRASPGTGLVIESTLYQGTVGPPTMTTPSGVNFTADGPLADALNEWSFAGDLGQYAYFTNEHADAPLTLYPLPGHSTRGASVRAVGGPTVEPTSAAVSSPQGIEVVRSVTAIPGWSATWHPTQGPTRSLEVKRYGLVQAVVVPAGRGVVTWTYDAPGVKWGVVLTLIGLALLLVFVGMGLTIRGTRRHDLDPSVG
jgi:hypothetical protein